MKGVLRDRAARRVASIGLVALMAGVGLTGTAIASAHPQARPTQAAVVVQVHIRHGFGKILTNVRGRALYYLPSGPCNSSCLAIWPPLLMPRGKTIPLGARCLRTARFGRRLQVTYNRHRLYTFVSDTGITPTGNGQGGFRVAKVVRGCP